jgi:flagellar hook protein FlgE
MSLFGSLFTAVSGMNAQSRALGNISDNVANSQTTGYKRLDTSFAEQLARTSNLTQNQGVVRASSQETVSISGTVETSDNPLSMALSGNGMFAVTSPTSTDANGVPGFTGSETLYTRAGDFKRDNDGYLVNGSGYTLMGWAADATGTVNQGALQPLRISDAALAPTATSAMAVSATLPEDASITGPLTTQAQAYAANGATRAVTLSFTRSDTGWDVTASSGGADLGTGTLTFNADGTVATGGTLGLAANADLGLGPITMDLSDMTLGSGTGLQLGATSANGSAGANYENAVIDGTGNVVANYDNGESRIVGQVPVMTFADLDGLERRDGQAFAATRDSGAAVANAAGTNGAASVESGAVERSNVDLTSEFAKLIVAQRAYSANTKLVTTSDEMLTETINMRR